MHKTINLNHVYIDETGDALEIISPTGEHSHIRFGPAGCCALHNQCQQIQGAMQGNLAREGMPSLSEIDNQATVQVCCTRSYVQNTIDWITGPCTGHGPWVQKSVNLLPDGRFFMQRWPNNS